MIFVTKAFKDSHDLAKSNFSSAFREPLSGCEAAAVLRHPPQLFLPTRKYGESEACAGDRKTSDTSLNPDTLISMARSEHVSDCFERDQKSII